MNPRKVLSCVCFSSRNVHNLQSELINRVDILWCRNTFFFSSAVVCWLKCVMTGSFYWWRKQSDETNEMWSLWLRYIIDTMVKKKNTTRSNQSFNIHSSDKYQLNVSAFLLNSYLHRLTSPFNCKKEEKLEAATDRVSELKWRGERENVENEQEQNI